MLFDDGVKIDLTLLPVSMLEEYLTLLESDGNGQIVSEENGQS